MVKSLLETFRILFKMYFGETWCVGRCVNPLKVLILDVVTCWNSIFLMLERAIDYQEVNIPLYVRWIITNFKKCN